MIWNCGNEREPRSLDEAQRIVREAAAAGQRMVFIGGETRLGIGAAPRALDLVLRTRRLDRIVEYQPADQIVVVEAGVRFAQLQAELSRHGQRLALDPAQPAEQTLGGIVASNAFGPLRTRFGSVRDLIIGVSILRADGERAKGGGKVVKTVAGFDLPKLMCGSLGTLGLIETATFRVHPLPERCQTILLGGLGSADVLRLALAMREKQLEPAALVAARTGPGEFSLAVRFEGFGKGVEQQIATARALAPFAESDDAPWTEHAALLCAGPVRLKISALPTQLPAVDAAVPAHAQLGWYPLPGLGFAAGELQPEAVRAVAACVVEQAPQALDAWGPPPAAIALHRAVKERFDPHALLAPGRFAGGI